jgi:AraC-like DNA-binding protein/mannose-6-phosphate isomerase-like protein (cupin superfamily)
MSRLDAIQQLNQIPIHIQADDFVAELLWWGMYEDRWWRNYLHVHSFYEICYAFAGRGTFFINNQQHTVQEGDLFIAHPHQYHEIISSEDMPLGIYFWSYTLSLNETHSDTSQLLDAFAKSPDTISQRISQIPVIIDLLIDEVRRREAGYIQSLQALTTKLLLETARSITNVSANTALEIDIQSTVVREVLQYLKDNYSQPIQIRDIATQVHMSERHVSRLFLKATNKTIKTYLTDLRLDKACNLLLEVNIPITEVARQTGYPDMRYFSTLFRRQFGITPSAFRHQHGTQFVD